MLQQLLLKIRRPQLSRSSQPSLSSSVEIRRRWVETADERCPLACVWFALPDTPADEDAPAEPYPSSQPAFSLFGWKAGYLHRFHILPATYYALPH